MLPRTVPSSMDKNQILALIFAILMATSMIAMGGLMAL